MFALFISTLQVASVCVRRLLFNSFKHFSDQARCQARVKTSAESPHTHHAIRTHLLEVVKLLLDLRCTEVCFCFQSLHHGLLGLPRLRWSLGLALLHPLAPHPEHAWWLTGPT